MPPSERVDLVERVLGSTWEVANHATPERLGDPTPCEDYSVGRLLIHQVRMPCRGGISVAVLVDEQIAEYVLHTWDLARGLGVPVTFDAETIAAAHEGLTLHLAGVVRTGWVPGSRTGRAQLWARVAPGPQRPSAGLGRPLMRPARIRLRSRRVEAGAGARIRRATVFRLVPTPPI